MKNKAIFRLSNYPSTNHFVSSQYRQFYDFCEPKFSLPSYTSLDKSVRLQLHGAIYRPDPFVLMLHYCASLKAIRYESMSLNRIVADKSYRVIVALVWEWWSEDKQTRNLIRFDPANFEVTKIYQRDVQSLYRSALLFLDSLAVFYGKRVI